VDFLSIAPQEIANLPKKALKFLEEASRRTPGSVNKPEILLEMAAKGYGNVYLIYDNHELFGATYFVVHDTDKGKVIGIILLGGKKINIWCQEYIDFMAKFQKMVGAIAIRSMARDGWAKFFPCKRIGSIFEVDLR
jgi:hypothetical protein